ncbi:ATP synthase subunit E [Oceaniovalibus guishaninsula JLT2003]|uniref:ATP synthase subunit E n=1 Tax=Oceaniovalibus guishaninsula JLT2003 TaxID=1231392 RepID=K2HPT5_9RHOB|nr:formate dehydrogenase subunit gamma [Oceaniovalibus guishaninsula]EKE44864.1 ATP synthase subunit E [Oceaniovalibus guishaninsula JLT2003]
MTPHAPAPRPDDVAAIVSAHLHLEGPLLPILHAFQTEYGCVPENVRPAIAAALNITAAELHGVMSFYHDFRDMPAGRHVLKICRAEACQSVGSDDLAASALARLGVEWHGTTQDGAVTVEPVYCLGLCACAPAVMIDGKVRGRMDAARLDAVLDEVRT